jgi:cyanophycinase
MSKRMFERRTWRTQRVAGTGSLRGKSVSPAVKRPGLTVARSSATAPPVHRAVCGQATPTCGHPPRRGAAHGGLAARGAKIAACQSCTLPMPAFARLSTLLPGIPRRQLLLGALAGLVLAAPAWAQDRPAPPSQNPGPAIAIGGALRLDNTAVWQRIVQEAGGPGSRFGVLATAAANPASSAERIVQALQAAGAQAEVIPVAPRLPGSDWQQLRDDPALAQRVAAMNGVFFSGGAQELIVDTLRPQGRETALLQAIRTMHSRGGVVAGTSAGAAIMSEWMFRDAQDPLRVLKGHMRQGQEIDLGLGFAGPALFVDQHFLRRGRIGRLLPVMVAKGYRWGLGVEEDSAAILRGERIEVIGARGALLVDLRTATPAPRDGAFGLQGAALSFLDRGDKFDLATGQLQPAADKLAGRIDPNGPGFKPYFAHAGFHPDLLGDNAIVHAMTRLVDSPDREVRGLVFNGRALAGADVQDEQPTLGFEFRLYKGADTLAWFTSARGAEDYSVWRLRLDVSPVRMAQPLYRPWSVEAAR